MECPDVLTILQAGDTTRATAAQVQADGATRDVNGFVTDSEDRLLPGTTFFDPAIQARLRGELANAVNDILDMCCCGIDAHPSCVGINVKLWANSSVCTGAGFTPTDANGPDESAVQQVLRALDDSGGNVTSASRIITEVAALGQSERPA